MPQQPAPMPLAEVIARSISRVISQPFFDIAQDACQFVARAGELSVKPLEQAAQKPKPRPVVLTRMPHRMLPAIISPA